MFIFGVAILLVGLYMFNGHKIEILTGRVAFKNLSKDEWKNIGKWTMITSVIPFTLVIIGLFLDL